MLCRPTLLYSPHTIPQQRSSPARCAGETEPEFDDDPVDFTVDVVYRVFLVRSHSPSRENRGAASESVMDIW